MFNEKKSVIVVDDEPGILVLTRIALSEFGYSVREAQNAEECMNELETGPKPDAVLVDVMLPGKSGFDVCKKIKSDSRFKGVKVLLYTVLSEEDMKDRAKECGADGYITKGISVDELVSQLKDVMAH